MKDILKLRTNLNPSHIYATQSNYKHFLRILEQKRMFPGTIIIDDKWQRTYGSPEPDIGKWVDMRGFIDRQHTQGRRVLLWHNAWGRDNMLG